MAKKSVQRSITMTQEMRNRLALLVSKQPRDTTEADLIREAIRLYLDNLEDIIGSRTFVYPGATREHDDQPANQRGC